MNAWCINFKKKNHPWQYEAMQLIQLKLVHLEVKGDNKDIDLSSWKVSFIIQFS